MRQSVRSEFVPFIVQFEGRTDFMYCDVLGLVTTGIGNLIDPMPAALMLPWLWRGTLRPATRLEVADAWRAVKARTDLTQRGGGAYRDVTRLFLTDEAISRLVLQRLAMNDALMQHRYSTWEQMPAPAQLAVHSMAWGMGPGFKFPKFDACMRAGDYAGAGAESRMSNGAPRRNAANRALLEAAAVCDDPDALDWRACCAA